MSIARTGISRTGLSASSGRLPEPAAPSGLTVSIAEATLEFGDTATASVSVAGYPFPSLAYQWTLGGVDVDGQTSRTFEGVPVGDLRVVVTASNTEGSAGPTASDPVTVSALLPEAFTAGQWSVDATGAIEQATITLFGLPDDGGAAISSVERAAGTQRQSWISVYDDADWSTLAISPFSVSHSPWGMADKEGGVMRTWAVYGGLEGVSLYVDTNDMPLGVGLPAGAPHINLGKHYDVESPVNPFVQTSLFGFRSDEITELTATASWVSRSTDATHSRLDALQIYASMDRTQDDGWNEAGATFFDIQVRTSPEAGTNFPAMTGTSSYTATIGGHEWNIVRTITTNQGADTRSWGFEPTTDTVAVAPLKAILDWLVAREVSEFSQADAWIWVYSVQAWTEPRSGITDVVISDFTVTFNGTLYESVPTWVALSGTSLNTAYPVLSLKDAEQTDFTIRAVNSVGNGPVSDTKLETPFMSEVPATLGDNEWTLQAVPSSTDLEITFNRPATDETGLQLEVDGVLKVAALDSALDDGPVFLDAPTFSGEPALGETLTAAVGRKLSHTGVTGSTWRWLRDGVAIGSATSSTYTIVEADSGTQISVEETATDAQGSTVAVSDPQETELAISITPRTGDFFVYELRERFPAEYAITSGTLPTGLSFMEGVGIIYGVPTVAGESIISLTATGDVTIPFTLTITVTDTAAAYALAEFDGLSYMHVGTIGVVTGAGTPSPIADSTSMSIFADVDVPATLTSTGVISAGSRLRFQVLSTGSIELEVDNTSGTNVVLCATNLGGGATDVRGGRHRLGVTVNTAGTATAVITVDGVVQPLTTTTLTTGTIDHTIMPYCVGARAGTSPDRIAPADFGFYQVGFWTDRLIDWTVADRPGFDSDAYGGAMVVIGGASSNWTTPTIRGQTSASAWSISGSAPTVTAVYGEDPTPRAFMETTGYARYTTGGLGETLYRVTNTSASASTSGSLPWALAQSLANGGGYILIEAEGPLELTDRLFVSAPNTTIDFRRSPGLGFWLTGAAMWIEVSNVVLRHPRCYPGSNFIGQLPTGRDGIIVATRQSSFDQSNIYIDRPDTMFALDESLSVYPYRPSSTLRDVTIAGALIAEACHTNIHGDEPPPTGTGVVDNHSKGLIVSENTGVGASVGRVTVINTLFASNDDRNPRFTGEAQEMISTVSANYGSTGIQVTSDATADMINCFFMLGDRPSNPTVEAHKWIQGTTSTTLEAAYETGCFTGAWTDAGGFDDAAMIDNWRNNTSSTTFMDASALDNPHLFTKSGAHAGALSYSDAFAGLADNVGALNATGERHPFAQRVITYVTEDVPFTTGWFGGAYEADMVPDEARAVGITIASGGAGALTVTLPAANTMLPPVTNRPWESVSVTVVNAYTDEIVEGEVKPSRTANLWSDGVSQAGSLAGGAVAFTGLPTGFYVARITVNATKADGVVPVILYTGRPVAVA